MLIFGMSTQSSFQSLFTPNHVFQPGETFTLTVEFAVAIGRGEFNPEFIFQSANDHRYTLTAERLRDNDNTQWIEMGDARARQRSLPTSCQGFTT